jgi:hypothetical protein
VLVPDRGLTRTPDEVVADEAYADDALDVEPLTNQGADPMRVEPSTPKATLSAHVHSRD